MNERYAIMGYKNCKTMQDTMNTLAKEGGKVISFFQSQYDDNGMPLLNTQTHHAMFYALIEFDVEEHKLTT